MYNFIIYVYARGAWGRRIDRVYVRVIQVA